MLSLNLLLYMVCCRKIKSTAKKTKKKKLKDLPSIADVDNINVNVTCIMLINV